MPYRAFLLVATVAAALCTLPGCAPEGPPARPNIVFLFADDLRYDAVGFHDNPYVRTPTIDSLAGAGFNFRAAHIMGSHHGAVCAPSRAMLMSGRTLFRVYDNLDTVATFPEALHRDGYVTFATGKWHQSTSSFARSFSQGADVFFGGMSDHDAVPVRDLLPDGSFTDVQEKGFSTDVFADAAIRFLEQHAAAGDTAPFLLYVSFTTPHDPRTPPEPYRSAYDGEGMPLPANFMPVHPFHNGWMTGRDEALAPWPRTTDVVREQIAEYYGLVEHMDHRIADILGALRRHGLDEETVVVFTSDNGLALGSHGLLGKQSLYEHSTRVPLLASGPGIPSGSSDALVMLYDLFPTITGLAGLATPQDVDGLDLAPLWRGESERVRNVIYTAYEDLQRAVHDGRWKLIRYPRIDHVQLFDLKNDPYELANRAGDEAIADRRAELETLMQAEHDRLGDPHPLAVDSLDTAIFDFMQIERQPDRHQPAWVVEKYFDTPNR